MGCEVGVGRRGGEREMVYMMGGKCGCEYLESSAGVHEREWLFYQSHERLVKQ